MAHSVAARHSIAEARALLQSAQANARARRCVHGGTRGRCRLCDSEHTRDPADQRVDRYLVDSEA
jgi:hypothetical protein